MQTKASSSAIAVVFCLLGGFALLSVFAGFSSVASIPPLLREPGSFLVSSFSWAAFYVPIYLFLSALLVYVPSARSESVAILNFTILPFLTVSLFLKLMFAGSEAPITRFIVNSVGQKGGAFLLLLLFVLELLLMFRMWSKFDDSSAAREEDEDEAAPHGAVEEATEEEPLYSSAILLDAPRERRWGDAQSEEHAASGQGPLEEARATQEAAGEDRAWTEPFDFPDLPPAPPLESLRAMDEEPLERSLESIPLHPDGEPVTARSSEAASGSVAAGRAESAADEAADGAASDSAASEEEEYVVIYRDGSFTEGSADELDVPEDAEETIDEALGTADAEDADEAIDLDEEGEEPVEGVGAAAAPEPRTGRDRRYNVPLGELLDDYPDGEYWIIDEVTQKAAETLKHTLEEFNIQAEVTGIRKGPVITMYEILPAPGVKLSKIVNLADNIALRLAASRVRIVAPIPGKHAVGIEVPNKHRAIVSFKEMTASEDFNSHSMEIPVVLGKDITGNAQVIDLVQTPHLLIAGATGSGKSVCVNSLICSVLYCRTPEQVRMILIDPKIVELKLYNDIPHLLTPVVTEPKKAFQALQYCIYEMERRYSLLDSMGVRDIRSYNKRVHERRLAQSPIPYILIIIDEFADLMATTGKELESTLARLAAMSRAVGIHLVLATQRPSIDVITGLIKANIPSRIAFMVASKFDSRIIIDAVGAEKLLGRGDMLFTSAQNPFPTRIQGAYLSEEEVERVTEHVKTLGEPEYIDDEIFIDEEEDDFSLMNDDGTDPMYDKALEIVVSMGKASASYLQRRLKIGYNRAARIVEDLEARGIVGPQQGSKPRDVIHVPERAR